jgi:hypothetical protein
MQSPCLVSKISNGNYEMIKVSFYIENIFGAFKISARQQLANLAGVQVKRLQVGVIQHVPGVVIWGQLNFKSSYFCITRLNCKQFNAIN